MSTVRTRIAPSPTGPSHLGTAYIALFNLCFAKQNNGQFILRIEDTDQARSTLAYEEALLQALNWLGLNWDEGPDIGGNYGPYRQSERLEIYQQHVSQLIENGHAFHCFCSVERLAALRKEQMAAKVKPGYDGCCLQLNKLNIDEKINNKEAFVIRMKVPNSGYASFKDRLRGIINIDWQQIDMQVIQKADGYPTYHLANVVDDHLMAITHVIRGEEWINSTPKHQLLYEYFGWNPPEFCHLPLLRNPDKSKLSKRKNPTSIEFYKQAGFLAEAVVNYLGRMGWSMPDEREKFSLEEMIAAFDIDRVSLGGPIFDKEKLAWLNGAWIREDINDEEFFKRVQQWIIDSNTLHTLIPLVKTRINTFSDLASLISHFFQAEIPIKSELFEHKTLKVEEILKVLQFTLWRLENINQWKRENIESEITNLAKTSEIKMRDFVFPLFIAMTGQSSSVSVIDIIHLIGLNITRARLIHAINELGGISKKAQKRLHKEFIAINR